MSQSRGAELIVSIYLYPLVILSAVTAVSPLIVINVPLLVVFGWPALSWWRHREDRVGIGTTQLIWMVFASLLIAGGLFFGAGWWFATISPAPPEAFLLAGMALCFLPLPIAVSQVLLIRRRAKNAMG